MCIRDRQILVGMTGLAFLLCLLGLVVRPAGPGILIIVSVGWSYGGFIAVIAAGLAVVAQLTAPRPRR